MHKLHLKNGDIGAYAIACGYVQELERNGKRCFLYKEGGVYFAEYQGENRIEWFRFATLSEARAKYKEFKKELTA
jgi:hypothetical protein